MAGLRRAACAARTPRFRTFPFSSNCHSSVAETVRDIVAETVRDIDVTHAVRRHVRRWVEVVA
jgi:hypothetical protein